MSVAEKERKNFGFDVCVIEIDDMNIVDIPVFLKFLSTKILMTEYPCKTYPGESVSGLGRNP